MFTVAFWPTLILSTLTPKSSIGIDTVKFAVVKLGKYLLSPV